MGCQDVTGVSEIPWQTTWLGWFPQCIKPHSSLKKFWKEFGKNVFNKFKCFFLYLAFKRDSFCFRYRSFSRELKNVVNFHSILQKIEKNILHWVFYQKYLRISKFLTWPFESADVWFCQMPKQICCWKLCFSLPKMKFCISIKGSNKYVTKNPQSLPKYSLTLK